MISDKTILRERTSLIQKCKNILGGEIGKELYKDLQHLELIYCQHKADLVTIVKRILNHLKSK